MNCKKHNAEQKKKKNKVTQRVQKSDTEYHLYETLETNLISNNERVISGCLRPVLSEIGGGK